MEFQDLQDNFEACVLYYCFDQKDATIYDTTLVALGGIVWKDNDRSMDRETWTREYPCPSNDMLLTYDLLTVLDYWNTTYVWPNGIKNTFASAFYFIDDESLARVHFDATYTGMMIYNTSRQQVQFFDGSSWVRLT